MENEVLTVHLTGDNFIDLDTLSKQVDNLKVTLNALTSNLLGDNKQVEITVSPFKPGSFTIELILRYAEEVKLLAPIALGVGTAYYHMVRLKKNLKGRDPKSIDLNRENNTYNVVSGDDAVTTYPKEVIDVYSKKTVNEAFDKSFKAILKDKTRNDYEVFVSTNREILKEVITQEELPAAATNVLISSFVNKTKIITSKVWLTVGDVNFLGKSKSIFLDINGHKLVADINDNEFLKSKLDGSLIFKSGMRLYVNLKTKEEYIPSKDKIEYTHFIDEVIQIDYGQEVIQFKIEN